MLFRSALSAKASCVHAPIYSRFHYTIPCAVLSPLHLRVDYGIVKKIRCVKAQGWNAMDENYVCIDIGGTAIKYGVATKGGRLREKGAVATEGKMYGARRVGASIQALPWRLCQSAHRSGDFLDRVHRPELCPDLEAL